MKEIEDWKYVCNIWEDNQKIVSFEDIATDYWHNIGLWRTTTRDIRELWIVFLENETN